VYWWDVNIKGEHAWSHEKKIQSKVCKIF